MSNPAVDFTFAGALRGARRISPVAVFTVPFGVAFGVAAAEGGMTPAHALAMSVSVFSGAAQFAVLDFWGESMPLLPLIVVAFAVNARHILMSASLHRWVEGVRPAPLYAAFAVLSDPNYIDTSAARRKGENDLGFLAGGGVALWIAWVVGTALGLSFGEALSNPRALGLDVVMVSFFAAMTGGAWTDRGGNAPWVAAALGTGVALIYLPENWHLIVGGLSGGMAGAFRES